MKIEIGGIGRNADRYGEGIAINALEETPQQGPLSSLLGIPCTSMVGNDVEEANCLSP